MTLNQMRAWTPDIVRPPLPVVERALRDLYRRDHARWRNVWEEWEQPALWAAPAFVQSISQDALASTTNVLAYSSNNTAGNFLVAVSYNDGLLGDTDTIADSKGNTWNKAITQGSNFGTKQSYIWYAENCIAGANTVTLTTTSAVNSILAIAEYSGLALSGSFDSGVSASAASPNGSPSTSADSGTVGNSAQASELWIGGAGAVGFASDNNTYTAGGSATIREQRTSVSGAQSLALSDKIVSAIAAPQATFTLSASQQWACLVAPFKAVVTGGLFRTPPVTGIGGGGPFFGDPLQGQPNRRSRVYLAGREWRTV